MTPHDRGLCGINAGPCPQCEQESPLPGAALQLYLQVKAFARDCVTHGDMTPAAERMLLKILTDWGKPNLT